MIEVCHLAGPNNRALAPFVEIIDLLGRVEGDGRFSPPPGLWKFLRRNGVEMVEFAWADRSRVPNPQDWGRYFKHDPRIMAVSHRTAFEPKRFYYTSALPQPLADARLF